MTPLNERIARLLEPEPKFESECHTGSVGCQWMRTLDRDLTPLTLSPSWRFKESLGDSMLAIERRFPLAKVELSKGKAKLTPWPDAKPVCFELGGRDSETSHALALALCAALEAEVWK